MKIIFDIEEIIMVTNEWKK